MAVIDLVRRGIDLTLGNIRTGHFQRSLALITAAEIYLEHDRAGFGNRVMWWPVWLGPVRAVAGVAGALSPEGGASRRCSAPSPSRQASPRCPHVQPGALEMGPPLFAPLLMSLVGGMGLVAAELRRESRDA
ncbi:hypothetical protein ACIRYZ_45965 [Kitasatospora sp. NPDC101155]|uniref:hypothetical protein n=1 Tax=Kitasatospora sp. NPDC101155 TaxID=3364097 RepID=UPI00380EFB10